MTENSSINKKIMRIFKKIQISVPLFLIITGAFILRLATLSKLMVFTPDEEYILYITQTLVKHLHIIWIGVSALGFDFYMGPGLNYFLVPFIWAFKGDPIIWGIVTSILGIATCFLVYWIGGKLFSQKTGLIAAIIYGFSALLIYYDQQPYPTGVPFLSISMFISLYMTKYSKKWWILFSFLYGLVFHIHLSLVLIILIAIYWAITHRKTWDLKTLFFSLIAFLLVISPLIGFDYFHKFSNVTAPIRVVQAIGKSKNKFDLGNRLQALAKPISRIWYLDIGKSNSDEILYPCNTVLGNNATKIRWVIVLILVILVLLFLLKKDVWKDQGKRLLLLFSIPFLIPFIFLSSIGSVEYYLLGFFPIFILIIAYGITHLPKGLRFFSYVILFIFVIYNIATVFSASGSYGLITKKKIIKDVMGAIGDSTYSLSETGGPCQGNAGWGYLFSVFGRRPDNNIADKQFSWLLPIGNMSKTKYRVLINETRFSVEVSGYKYKLIEGGFTSYIFSN